MGNLTGNYRQMVSAIQGDMTASYWLKEELRVLDQRDPLDALADAELLLEIQRQRVLELQHAKAGRTTWAR